jgi:hypothetical protein
VTRSWSDFGVAEPSEAERDRAIVLGGGCGRVLSVSWNKSWLDGKIDDRFYVTHSQIPLTDEPPRRGDVVLWRSYNTADPDDWALWGAPTRVVDVRHQSDWIDVWCLEDADLVDRTPEGVNHDAVEQDRVLSEDELWGALAQWGLFAYCPRCGGDVHRIAYGLLAGPPPFGFIAGGCTIIIGSSPGACCRACGWSR